MAVKSKTNLNNINEETEHWLSFCAKRGRFDASAVALSESALLVVDVQEYFFNPDSPAYVSTSEDIYGNIAESIGFFRKHKRPLIFTRHAEKRNSPEFPRNRIWRSRLTDDMPLSVLYGKLQLNGSEKVLTKESFSAFRGGELENFLTNLNIRFVFMVGVNTHICIESSARDATDCGFLPIILADACASWKTEQHVRSLISISDGIGWIARLSDLKELR